MRITTSGAHSYYAIDCDKDEDRLLFHFLISFAEKSVAVVFIGICSPSHVCHSQSTQQQSVHRF